MGIQRSILSAGGSKTSRSRSSPGSARNGTLLALLLLASTQVLLPGCRTMPVPQDPYTIQVEALLNRLTVPDEPGLAITVVRNGEVLLSRGFGLANMEYGIPVTAETPFNVASVAKQFTAFSILLLEEEGALSLDDDIQSHLGYLPHFGHTITIRDLIRHTSGLRDQWELLILAGWHPGDVIFQEQIIRMIVNQRELNFEPGSEFLYSNTGYTLLAEIISRTTGRPFSAWIEERVFEPLGMSQTRFQEHHEQIIPGRAYPYLPDPGTGHFRQGVQNHSTMGATNLYTTASDLGRWLRNLETGEVGGPTLIRKFESSGDHYPVDESPDVSYGYGLYHDHFGGLPRIYHAGEGSGYQSMLLRYPEQNLGIAILSNNRNQSVQALGTLISQIYLSDVIEPAPARRIEPQRQSEPGEFFLISLFRYLYGAIVQLLTETEIAGDASPDTVEPPAPLFSHYQGHFYSHELETIYNLFPINDFLVIEYRQKGFMLLNQSGEDQFTVVYHNYLGYLPGPYIQIRFIRDESGAVSGFTIDMERVKNLKFDRIEL